jgi:hypothetical protein
MAKNFNAGVSALSELGQSKLEEADAVMAAARAWLSAAVQEAKQSIEELLPAAKRQRTRNGRAKPVVTDPCDKVRDPNLALSSNHRADVREASERVPHPLHRPRSSPPPNIDLL